MVRNLKESKNKRRKATDDHANPASGIYIYIEILGRKQFEALPIFAVT